ncbi:MAG: DPP IV N-terminal domain-containing protein, partial [Gemmatimonadales bacterium]
MKRLIAVLGAIAAAACSGNGDDETAALPVARIMSPDTANHQVARFSPDWSRVYWWQGAAAGRDLWTADSNFAGAHQLPDTSLVAAVEPIWSPDGKEFAVPTADTGTGVSAIMVMATDGSNARRLPIGSGLFIPLHWHPDGDGLDYFATIGGSFRTFTTSVAHGGSHPTIPGETRTNLAYGSPDGLHIVYMVVDKGMTTLWVADSSGQHARQLTTDGFEQFAQTGTPWSPDGKWIAYESRRTGTADIWVVSADSGAPRQLTRDVRNDWWPIWSPDSRWIAFLSDRGHQTDVWVVSAAGGNEMRVTNDPIDEELMQWRAGTLQFAWLTGKGSSGIWSHSVADGTEHQLTPDSIETGIPGLSPDGTKIAFTISRNGGITDLAVMPAAGGPIRIVVTGGSNSEFKWSPDGKKLAVITDRGGTPDLWA